MLFLKAPHSPEPQTPGRLTADAGSLLARQLAGGVQLPLSRGGRGRRGSLRRAPGGPQPHPGEERLSRLQCSRSLLGEAESRGCSCFCSRLCVTSGTAQLRHPLPEAGPVGTTTFGRRAPPPSPTCRSLVLLPVLCIASLSSPLAAARSLSHSILSCESRSVAPHPLAPCGPLSQPCFLASSVPSSYWAVLHRSMLEKRRCVYVA